jgi:hypothetical protein
MIFAKTALKTFLAGTVMLVLVNCAATTDDSGPRVVTRLPTDAEVEQHNALVNDPGNRIVCRDETAVGTNIPKRKCHVVRDLQNISTFHRQELKRALR